MRTHSEGFLGTPRRRRAAAWLIAIPLSLSLAACASSPSTGKRDTGSGSQASLSPLKPGSSTPDASQPVPPQGPQTPREKEYAGNPYNVSEGKRLYEWFNCVGCHAHGGGGMGPALMDDTWIYGSSLVNIHDSIVEGRPNGMPSFRGKIPETQVWQIAAYVQSTGGLVSKNASPGRSDHMQMRPAESSTSNPPPRQVSQAHPR